LSGRRGRQIQIRLAAAVAAAKLASRATRALGRGGGTALPGLVASRIHPGVVGELSRQLEWGSIVVSGTNGKTTTSRLLSAIFTAAGNAPLHNHAGSNLMRGLASAMIGSANFLGRLSQHSRSVGLFEVDEAALPEVLHTLQPARVLLLNLFRDQLDRYGEVATIARLWREALLALSATSTVIGNADDPLVAAVIGETRTASVLYFGIDSCERKLQMTEHASDVKSCPRCGGKITYDAVFLGHLGHYHCESCRLRRPQPSLWASDVRLRGMEGSAFRLCAGDQAVAVTLPLPGLYNVYNAVAAAASAWCLGVTLPDIATSLGSATAAFGRMERIVVKDREIILALAKNPAGLNEVLRTVADDAARVHLLVMLNDRTADGHDVSWIWDADIEMLRERLSTVVFSGSRANDMALRFKYAGLLELGELPQWRVISDSGAALREFLALTPAGSRLYIVPTYTALLDVRAVLTASGHVKAYWKD